MGQAPSKGHEARVQSGLGAGCSCAQAKKELRGMRARAQALRISTPPSFPVAGVSLFMSPPRSAMRRGAWKPGARNGSGLKVRAAEGGVYLPILDSFFFLRQGASWGAGGG